MTDSTKNHTLRLLQEMREEMRNGFAGASAERSAMLEQLDSIQGAVAGISYIQADQRGLFEELDSRLRRVENKLGLAGAPAE